MNATNNREYSVIAQLSDLHYVGDDRLSGGLSLSGTLEKVVSYLQRPEYKPEAVLITGDLLHREHTGSYQELKTAFDAISQALQIPVYVTTGNHDTDEVRNYFEVESSVQIADYRLIYLDNIAPRLSAHQLDFLNTELKTKADRGTILALHHSPLPSPVTSLHNRGLQNVDALARVLHGSDVVQILTGHYHYVQAGSFAGIPVWTGPALANHTRLDPPQGHAQAVLQSGFSLIQLAKFGTVANAIWLDDRPEIFNKKL